MKYCTNCGHQMTDDMMFCSKCGTKAESLTPTISENVGVNISPPISQKKKKSQKPPKFAIILSVILILILIVALVVSVANGNITDHGNDPTNNIPVLCDVEKFANITSAELVNLIGKPDNVVKTTTNGFAEFPCVYYEYNNAPELGEVSFILINDSVVKFVSIHSYKYNDGKKILESFNLTAGKNCASDKKDTYARYRCVSDKVDDLWITLIDKESDTFESLQVTYDMFYFTEWYIPLTDITEETSYQVWTQNAVKSLLKSPSTAKFPGILEWQIVKNEFYVLAGAYVDAQNSFGATIRSEFAFVYKVGTSTIVYAVFDKEVVANNGYVETEDLVADLIDKKKTDSALTVPEPTVPSKPNETTPDATTKPTESETKPTDPPAASHTHSYGKWTEHNGKQHKRTCKTCDYVQYANHSWDSGTVTKEATCATEGAITYTCKTCSDTKTESIAKTSDHSWDEGVVLLQPNCSSTGLKDYTCTICSTVKTVILEKIEHKFSEKVESNRYLKAKATYTTGAVYYYSCSCGEKGLETFSLNNRIEWVTTAMLQRDFNLSSGWIGETELRIWTYTPSLSEQVYSYLIYDQMRNGMGDSVYNGSYNGVTVRFYVISHSTNYAFYYDDLVAAGIIK